MRILEDLILYFHCFILLLVLVALVTETNPVASKLNL